MAIFSNEIMEESNQFLYEFNEGITKATFALYVSDIMIEQSVNEGNENVEVLVESSFKEWLGKVKQTFINLWKRIKEWFKHHKDTTYKYYKQIETVIKKSKMDILDNFKNKDPKEVLGEKEFYRYKEKWDPIKVFDRLKGMYIDIERTLNNESKNMTQDDELTNLKYFYEHEEEFIDDKSKSVHNLKNVLYSSLSDKDKKNTIDSKNINQQTINEFIKDCENCTENYLKINEIEKTMNDTFNKILNKLKELERGDFDNEKMDNIKKSIIVIEKKMSELQSAVSFTYSEQLKYIKNEFSLLKLYMKKPVDIDDNSLKTNKESYTSIFEAAYNMI